MAYSATAFFRVDGVPGQQLFMYTTADLASVFEASAYFDDAVDSNNLSTGDVIHVVSTASTAAGDFYVVTNTAGTITTTQRT